MPVLKDSENCTGCSACANICHQGAITYNVSDKGFLYPVVNNSKCVNCHLCEKVCFESTNVDLDNVSAFAYKNDDDIRRQSSSGGAFPLFRDYVLNRGGVVYGAYLDDNLVCRIGRAENMEECFKFSGSKLVQSDMGNAIKNVEKDLLNSREVLFSGLACEIAGLKKYLKFKGVNDEKLISVDLICHGAPSPKVFNSYIRFIEKKEKCKVGFFDTRVNRDGKTGMKDWMTPPNSLITTEKGKEIRGYYSSLGYIELFYKNICFKPSCYNCSYPTCHRFSDFTVGDYWGGRVQNPQFLDALGVSVIVCNNENANRLFDALKGSNHYIDIGFENCSEYNKNLVKPTKKPLETDEFWKDYNSIPFEKIIKKYNGYTFSRRIKRFIKIKLLKWSSEYKKK